MLKFFLSLFVATLLCSHAFCEQNNELQLEKKVVRKSTASKATFAPFTGKIKGHKVRVRLQPDLDGYIIKELDDQDLVVVIDHEGDYWCIQAPEEIRAYIFRSFVLDDVVEGNRVNVRLEPDLEAPVIGHLNTGDRVKGVTHSGSKKWLEIDPPAQARFYVAKEFIQNIGGPEYKAQMQQRRTAAQKLLEQTQGELKTASSAPFEEINFEHIKRSFQTVINDYSDFHDKVLQAKEGLATIQELYLNKRIIYLETQTATTGVPVDKLEKIPGEPSSQGQPFTLWEPLEEALYLTWAHKHDNRSINDYYEEQRLSATHLSGVLELFTSPIKKHKPGDYVLRDDRLPVAYLYSTKMDLSEYVGKKVTLIGSQRPNHHFAFPTFFVHSIE